MDKNIKIILVSSIGLLVFAAAGGILVSNIREAGEMVDWVPLNIDQEAENNDQYENHEEQESKKDFEGKWMWKETVYNNDSKDEPKNPENFILTLKKNGSFSSTTDCNNLVGGFEVEGREITFGEIGSTLMACMGETQQDDYMKTLGEVQAYFVNDQGQLILELPYDTGSMIFESIE